MEKICFINSLTFQFEATARIFYAFAKKNFEKDTKNKISLNEYAVLETIVLYPHLDNAGLAKTLLKDISTVQKIISTLIKKNYIKEVKNNSHEIRVKYYELTRNGERLYLDYVPQNDKMLAMLANFITEKELLQFTKTLLKIRNIVISLDS